MKKFFLLAGSLVAVVLYVYIGEEESEKFAEDEHEEREKEPPAVRDGVVPKPSIPRTPAAQRPKERKRVLPDSEPKVGKLPPEKRQLIPEDVSNLYTVSDGGREWLVSKKYSAVACDLHSGENIVRRMGEYCVVKKGDDGPMVVAYDKKTQMMGVVTGGITLTVGADDDVEAKASQFLSQSNLTVLETNSELNTIFLKVTNPEDATTVTRFLSSQGEYASVEMEVYQGGPYAQ